jgi:hypothetical protein
MLVRHLTFANVCSALALTVALGTGGAYAANTVRSKDIVNGQVKAADLKKNAVTSDKIKDGNVGSADLAAGSVDGSKVTDGSLSGSDLAAGSLDGSKVKDESLTFSDIAGGEATGNVSFNAGFIANGRCRDFVFSIGGDATTGDAVVFSVRGPMQQGVFLYGTQVISDTQVGGEICNLSGTTMTAITELPVRLLTFH